MRLIAAVLGFVGRKAIVAAALLLLLFTGVLVRAWLIPEVRHTAEGLREATKAAQAAQQKVDDAVPSQTADTRGDVDARTRTVAEQDAKSKKANQHQHDVCGFWERLPEEVSPVGPNPCKDARQLAKKASDSLRESKRKLDEAKDDLATLQNPDLTNEEKLERIGGSKNASLTKRLKAARADLRESESTRGAWVLKQWYRWWKSLLWIVVVLMLGPPAARTVAYFALMPAATLVRKPIRLADELDHPAAAIEAGAAERTLRIQLPAGAVLTARSEHLRPVHGRTRSRLLYDWSAPFMSFASGLHGLSRIEGDEEGIDATLATPDDPNSYLMRIDFRDHPGVVMHTRHVVGVIGTPRLEKRWQWGLQPLLMWQVRYILFAGTGGLIVQGRGDVVATNPGGNETLREHHLVMGFDSRLTVGVNRTEVFWPYLRGKTPIINDEFRGAFPIFWQKASTQPPTYPGVKVFNVFFSAIGKFLGF